MPRADEDSFLNNLSPFCLPGRDACRFCLDQFMYYDPGHSYGDQSRGTAEPAVNTRDFQNCREECGSVTKHGRWVCRALKGMQKIQAQVRTATRQSSSLPGRRQ